MRVGQSGPVKTFLDESVGKHLDPREVLVILAPREDLLAVVDSLGEQAGHVGDKVWNVFHALSEVLVDEQVASPLSNAELDKKIVAMEKANPGLMDAVAGAFFR